MVYTYNYFAPKIQKKSLSVHPYNSHHLVSDKIVKNISPLIIPRYIIESVDSISRDEQDVPLTQYITNA